jgi:hypothetical protein
MAHFVRPQDGDLGEYDADNKMGVGSLWRMSIPVGGTGAEVALWGGQGLAVRSNNENAVKNPLPERTTAGFRIFRLTGVKLNETTMIEFGAGSPQSTGWRWDPGSPWPGALQVRVTATARITRAAAGDTLITLHVPSMAFNAAGIPYLYHLQYNETITAATAPSQIIAKINAHGKLKHLVFNCHGYIDYVNHVITNSRIAMGTGFSDPDLFSQFKNNLIGGVIWLAGCVIGNDNDRNIARAGNAKSYVVAPTMPMQLKPGLVGIPPGKLDMLARFSPKVFTPAGGLMSFLDFLSMGAQLGFDA